MGRAYLIKSINIISVMPQDQRSPRHDHRWLDDKGMVKAEGIMSR